jgi:chromosome partitioning protein
MAHRIAIASQKGGVGKTTICLNLAVALAESGRSTLAVDLDPQGGIALSLARGDTEWAGLAEHLVGEVSIEQAIFTTKLPGLSLLPRGRLDPVEAPEFEDALRAPGALEGVLKAVDDRFEYVLIDTPGGLGSIARAALSAAGFALVPVPAEPLGLRSVWQVMRVLEHVQSSENPKLKLLGILPTMVELNREVSLEAMEKLWTGFSAVLDTGIPRAEIFARASQEGLPLSFLGGRTPPEARRFALLASEVASRVQQLSQVPGADDEQPRRELV